MDSLFAYVLSSKYKKSKVFKGGNEVRITHWVLQFVTVQREHFRKLGYWAMRGFMHCQHRVSHLISWNNQNPFIHNVIGQTHKGYIWGGKCFIRVTVHAMIHWKLQKKDIQQTGRDSQSKLNVYKKNWTLWIVHYFPHVYKGLGSGCTCSQISCACQNFIGVKEQAFGPSFWANALYLMTKKGSKPTTYHNLCFPVLCDWDKAWARAQARAQAQAWAEA